MTEKFWSEFKPRDDASSLLIENFFKSLRDGESIEITEEDREKYGLLVTGPISEDTMKFSVEGSRELNEIQQKAKDFVGRYIKKFVEDVNKKNEKEGKKQMEDWPKINIADVKVMDNGECNIVARTGETSYGRVVAFKGEGLRKAYDDYAKEYSVSGEEILPFEEFERLFMPNVPAVSTLIMTADNNILLTKRSPRKDSSYEEAWHLPAGYLDNKDKNERGEVDPFIAAKREINEEVGLTKEQIDDLVCLGIMRNRDGGINEFLFVARTTMRSDEIVDKNIKVGESRLLLHPKDIDGDVRPRKLIKSGKISTVLPALLKIDEVFGKDKKGEPGPELTVPSSKALFFLVDKLLKKMKS